MNTTKQDIETILDAIDNEDETIDMLQKAMEFYCGTYDICEGYKYAIRQTLADQWDNHEADQEPESLNELSDILNGSI